jgi:hypothetical protein
MEWLPCLERAGVAEMKSQRGEYQVDDLWFL